MDKNVMRRREFLKSGLIGSFVAGSSAGKKDSPAGRSESAERENNDAVQCYLDEKGRRGPFLVRKQKRPHIFLISADMISPDCYLPSREISHHVNLKNIRSISEEGTRFDNALCTIPLCGPSRASTFTGKYPPFLTNNERAPLGMKVALEAGDIIFQEYLRKSGYNTKHVGKCHVGALKFMDAFGENDAAWDRWAPPLMEDDGYVDFLRMKGVKPHVYRKVLQGKQIDRKSPGNTYGGWIQQEDGSEFPLDAHYSMYLAEKAINKLDAALKQTPGSPVYLQLDFFDPHQPYSIPSCMEARAEELRGKIVLPQSYERVRNNDFQPLKGDPDIYQVYRQYWGAYDPELVREYIVGHFLQMEIVDIAVGKLLDEIKKRGLYDDSLIIFTGDHGDMNGRLALFDKGVYFHPDIFRVPLYCKPPAFLGQALPSYERPVSLLDIFPTILAGAGIQINEYMDGETLLPVISGLEDREKLEHLFQSGWHVGVNYGVGISIYDDPQHHWFYAYNISSGIDELYNMAENDGINLSSDQAYLAIKKKIILRLGEILKDDPRWLGYWSTFRIHKAKDLPGAGGDMQMFAPK